MKRRGFTLIELLVVIAIIAILAAIIFPVLMRAKRSGKQSVCLSNLKQVGDAIAMYMSDGDDRWPRGIDPADKYTPQIWNRFPDFQKEIPNLPLMHDLLLPYCPSKKVWQCPADNGQVVDDVSFELLDTRPSSYEKYGTSYYYRTELTVLNLSGTSLQEIASVNVYFDGSGSWHTNEKHLFETDTSEELRSKLRGYRYNVLFGDLHAKNITRADYDAAWATPVDR
ncbi:MAG: prepilin-type N-terminal cleavage/methylation domain-containing protein [Fimbriimonadales bacterium]